LKDSRKNQISCLARGLGQRLRRRSSKNNLEGMGRKSTKERRPEQTASHHFSDHGWLSATGEKPPIA
jgi:hypothetical protein